MGITETVYGDYVFPREQDIDVALGDDLRDMPVVSVFRAGLNVYVEVGHENVGSVTIRLAAHVARQLGWSLTQQSVLAQNEASADYVLTEKGREVVDA